MTSEQSTKTFSTDGHELNVGDKAFVIVQEFPTVKVAVKTIGELHESGRKITYSEPENGYIGSRIQGLVFKDGDACNQRVEELTKDKD